MIERDFVAQKTKEFHIRKYLENKLSNVGLSKIKLKKIPLGEKIIVSTSRPGLIVGSKGTNIKDLTRHLKKKFGMENPQIEINEIKNIFLDANVVAEKIAFSLERFGSARFKGIGHKMLENVIKAGALGVEINISGKIPGARAKSWRFYQGYLKKCGDISLIGVRKAKKVVTLKSGVIGIKVAIMPPDIKLPDKIIISPDLIEKITDEPAEKPAKKPAEDLTEAAEEKVSEKKETGKRRPEIPSAEELIKETKDHFAEENKISKRKEKTAEQLISEALAQKP